ncbi:hypothetical protein [Wenyingzhuangia sp. IMCC45574]
MSFVIEIKNELTTKYTEYNRRRQYCKIESLIKSCLLSHTILKAHNELDTTQIQSIGLFAKSLKFQEMFNNDFSIYSEVFKNKMCEAIYNFSTDFEFTKENILSHGLRPGFNKFTVGSFLKYIEQKLPYLILLLDSELDDEHDNLNPFERNQRYINKESKKFINANKDFFAYIKTEYSFPLCQVLIEKGLYDSKTKRIITNQFKRKYDFGVFVKKLNDLSILDWTKVSKDNGIANGLYPSSKKFFNTSFAKNNFTNKINKELDSNDLSFYDYLSFLDKLKQ